MTRFNFSLRSKLFPVLLLAFFLIGGQDIFAVSFDWEAQLKDLKEGILKAQIKLARIQNRETALENIPADFMFKQDLKVGDYNEQVRYFQIVLANKGFWCKNCRVTGFFGMGTQAGLKLFEKKYALFDENGQASTRFDSSVRQKLNEILVVSPRGGCQPAKPLAPKMISPENNAIGQPLDLNLAWKAPSLWGQGCPDKKSYVLQLADNPDFNSPLIDEILPEQIVNYDTLPNTLLTDTIYYWRLSAQNNLMKSDFQEMGFGTSFSPTLDFSINGVRGPLSINYNNSLLLSWTSPYASHCSASGDWSGEKKPSGQETIEKAAANKTFTISCEGEGGKVEKTLAVEVILPPTLSVDFEASRSNSDWKGEIKELSPLTLSLRAKVGGTAKGPISYKFECGGSGQQNYVFSKIDDEEKILERVCQYPPAGNFQAKLLVERFWMKAEKTIPIEVSPTLLSDLDVTYIERIPRYLRRQDSYLKGLASVGFALKVQKAWPDKKEKVFYIAHVANKGARMSESFKYYWLVNNVTQVVSRAPGLASGEETSFVYQREFPQESEQIAFQVDPMQEFQEASKKNNYLAVGSHDLVFSVWVDKSFYESFGQNKNYLGSYSFEDWLQAHFTKANVEKSFKGRFFQARLDKIVIIQNPADFSKDPSSAFFDGQWYFDKDGKGLGFEPSSNFGEINQGLVETLASQVEKSGLAATYGIFK